MKQYSWRVGEELHAPSLCSRSLFHYICFWPPVPAALLPVATGPNATPRHFRRRWWPAVFIAQYDNGSACTDGPTCLKSDREDSLKWFKTGISRCKGFCYGAILAKSISLVDQLQHHGFEEASKIPLWKKTFCSCKMANHFCALGLEALHVVRAFKKPCHGVTSSDARGCFIRSLT